MLVELNMQQLIVSKTHDYEEDLKKITEDIK
jgi:hypothetical protein